MYRLNYTQLNKKQVEDVLAKATFAPKSASGFCSKLVGKTLKIVLDKLPVEGPSLEYTFKTDTKLALIENGAAAVECDYGALSLKNITLFSHMVPGTKRGYTVIVNWDTTVVTAYEMWFIDYEGEVIDTNVAFLNTEEISKLPPFINREVQRQCYYGYFEEAGKTPPEQRDKLTLQLENCMIKWCEDRGKHRLTTYTSTTFTTLVELDTPDGGDVLTLVADLLQINDSMFIHCFGEVEYSGRLSVEVFDLFSMKKVGVCMGIDEDDAFEFELYKSKGDYLGRYAAFFDFNDKGDQYSTFITDRIDFSVKGARASYRPSFMAKKPTVDEITEASKDIKLFGAGMATEMVMASAHTLPDSDYCVGKECTFRGDDGYAVDLRFKTITELEYRMEGEKDWKTEVYRAVELDEDFIVFGFYRSGSNPPANFSFAIDFNNGLATCISSIMGSKYDLRDPVPSYHFGIIEMKGLTPIRIFRHGFTDELLGRAFTQSYSDAMSSVHIYNAPHSYSWTIINNAAPGSPANRAGGYVWSSPCEYLKFRDELYAMIWVEQKWSGGLCTLFRNLRTERECGFGYGLTHDAKSIGMHKMGAKSRDAGRIDLSGIFTLHNFDVKS
ncbi:MAG: molybdenum cofactor biosynthesis F family protein [Oscillospiraceae bacterium]|nr:molybdenum cofactor biosynthesis F family protein [Oscillospiraceae bacterium]